MDLRPRIAGRIIDRIQEFITPLGIDEYDRAHNIIMDELSAKDRVFSRRGGAICVDYDQDTVQDFLGYYPELRSFIEEDVIPVIRRDTPEGTPIEIALWNDPETGMGVTWENRHIEVSCYVDQEYLESQRRPAIWDPEYSEELDGQWREELQVNSSFRDEIQGMVRIYAKRSTWHSTDRTRLELALYWMNVRPGWLRHTVQLESDLVDRVFMDPPQLTEQETMDLCTLLGINYGWISSPEPAPLSAYESWSDMRTRKGE